MDPPGEFWEGTLKGSPNCTPKKKPKPQRRGLDNFNRVLGDVLVELEIKGKPKEQYWYFFRRGSGYPNSKALGPKSIEVFRP